MANMATCYESAPDKAAEPQPVVTLLLWACTARWRVNLLVVCVALAAATLLAFTPALRRSRAWRATVTPLASIMGSGFLVCAPLLVHEVGSWAPVAMAALLAVAYAVGAMIRINIRWAEPLDHTGADREHSRHAAHRASHAALSRLDPDSARSVLEQLSHWVLAAAYVVSVSYYLQLLSVFVLDRLEISNVALQRALTTALLLLIAGIGTARGLSALEKIEVYAVSLNLGMIAALLVALCVFDTQGWLHGRVTRLALQPQDDGLHAIRTLMGLLIVVQGFETSRFLGAEHSPRERVVTMRKAQWIASAVYLAFITLALPLFGGGEVAADVTAIIALVHPVAQPLPALIVLAAALSQFSAAVADDAGCAGLGESLLRGRLSPRSVYAVLGFATILLTWLTDVLSIISLASRAFALFYALQCAVTAAVAQEKKQLPRRGLVRAGSLLLGCLCLAVTLFGVSAE